MKTISRRLSAATFILCAIAILFSISPALNASAATSNEAADWARQQIGKWIDYDGAYGAQCVDLIKAYYVWLGAPVPYGNGYQYWTNSLPGGWTRIANTADFVPQAGDIMVWNTNVGGGYGHVAIVLSANINSFVSVDQNWVNSSSNGSKAAQVTHNYSNVYGVIRPCFSGNTSSTPGAGNNPAPPSTNPGNDSSSDALRVKLAEWHDGTGAWAHHPIGNYPTPSTFQAVKNDAISYIQVPDGSGIIIWKDADYKGDWRKFSAGTYDLESIDGGKWNDSISSFVIMRESDLIAYAPPSTPATVWKPADNYAFIRECFLGSKWKGYDEAAVKAWATDTWWIQFTGRDNTFDEVVRCMNVDYDRIFPNGKGAAQTIWKPADNYAFIRECFLGSKWKGYDEAAVKAWATDTWWIQFTGRDKTFDEVVRCMNVDYDRIF